jgi:uncharacterized protein YdaU (DUF1376 family)
MAREDRPYFPWYYKDWLTSPDRFEMTYEQRGVYRDLLDYSWDQRGLPVNTETIRQMLGLDKRRFALIWPGVAPHFYEEGGRLFNGKQERVRAEADAFKQSRSNAGKAGNAARWNRKPVAGESQPDSDRKDERVANPSPSLASSSASSLASSQSPDPPTSNPSEAKTSSPLTMSPLRFQKLQETHAFVGSRLRVPFVLHDEFRSKCGDEAGLQAWYEQVNTEVEIGQIRFADVFEFLRPRFKAWVGSAVADDEMRKFREGA